MKYVLDASALLAMIANEPGSERVAQILNESVISSINHTEVASKLIDLGMPESEVVSLLNLLGLESLPFDLDQSYVAASLRSDTRKLGLSLGDRACLALARHKNLTAVTADRTWNKLKLNIPIECIRS